MSILEYRWRGSDYTKKYQNDHNLFFQSAKIGDENVKYDIFIYGQDKKIGQAEFIRTENDNEVHINHKYKAPDKEWLLKLMGVLPELVSDYHHSYDPEREIARFMVTPISQTETKRFSSDEYQDHCRRVITNAYRVNFMGGELIFYKFGNYS